MGLAEAIAEVVAGPPPSRQASTGGTLSFLYEPGSSSLAVPGVGIEQGRRVTTAWACIRLISQLCGTLPVKIVRRGDKMRAEVRTAEFAHLWDRPNPEMTGTTFWTQQFMSSLTYGNPFAWKGRAEGTRIDARAPWKGIDALWPLHPRDVKIGKGPNSEKFFIVGGDLEHPYMSTEIAHTPYLSQDGYVGLSPIQDNAASLGIAIQAERQESTQLRDGLRTPGVLTSDAIIDEDSAKQVVERWMENKTGTNQRPIVLGHGAKFEAITLTPADAQLLEVLSRFGQDTPLQIYGVPPHMVSLVSKTTSWGSGIEQMFIGFLVTVMLPFLIPFEKLYGSECLDADLTLKFTVNNLLRGDMNARSNFYRTLRGIGAMSADTILELEDLPPRGIADDYLSPMNMTRLTVGSGASMPAADDGVAYAGLPVIAEARCPDCGTVCGRNVIGGDLWCKKCKAERKFGPLARAAVALSGEHALPRDRQDFWSMVGEVLSERMIEA